MASAVDPHQSTRCITNKAGPYAFSQQGSSDKSSSNSTATLEAPQEESPDKPSSNVMATLEVEEAPSRAKLAQSSKWINVSVRARHGIRATRIKPTKVSV